MTDWENQETDRKYNDSLIFKLFCFQFVNSYASLFYIAFIKNSTFQRCAHGDCMGELQVQLVSIYFTNLFLNLLELGIPLLLGFYRLKKEQFRAKKFGKELSLEEKESIKSAFDTTIDDYMEIIIGYGYMVLFGMAFPFTPLFALVLAIIEIRVDAIKFCYLTRRPFPSQDNSIRIWNDISITVSYIGTAINLAVLIFTANAFRIENDSNKWICFVITEHAFFVFKSIVIAYIKNTPAKVTYGIIWGDRIVNEKLYGKLADIDIERNVRNLHFDAVKPDRTLKLHEIYSGGI